MSGPRPVLKFDLGDVIEQAAEDLKVMDVTEGVSVRMDTWFRTKFAPSDSAEASCLVCLAGATIARGVGFERLKAACEQLPLCQEQPDMMYREGIIHLADADRMWALDQLRTGYLDAALRVLAGAPAWNVPYRTMAVVGGIPGPQPPEGAVQFCEQFAERWGDAVQELLDDESGLAETTHGSAS